MTWNSPNSRPFVECDVTDLVEFACRQESVSGVQRVVAETVPFLLKHDNTRCVFLDRSRGVFIPLNADEQRVLVTDGARVQSTADRAHLAEQASLVLQRGTTADGITIGENTTLVFLGALWINLSLMNAARAAHSSGAKIVTLLYDLTPTIDVGHTAAVRQLFDCYLTFLLQCASRVPAISRSTRLDFERYADGSDNLAPPGCVTGLPCGLAPAGNDLAESPWPRPYALFVGTIESRKNHSLALLAWQELVKRHGADNVPDLVCIGRLGWNVGEFLREYIATRGLAGKVSVLSASIGDAELARFYTHAEFTVYPSKYEGWGLPVSESLAFGKVPVVADISSLPEVGGDIAVYFRSGDLDSLVEAVEGNVLDPFRRRELEEQIQNDSRDGVSWEYVAEVITREIEAAKGRDPMFPLVELGREYVLGMLQPGPDEGYGDQYLKYLVREGLTPMLGQPRGERDFEVTDPALIGSFGSPQTWGYEIRPGRSVEFRFTRPTDGSLILLIATRSMPGKATIEVAGPGGPLFEDLYLGSVIRVPLGDGKSGEFAQSVMTVTDAHDSVEGFLGIRSFVVLREDDKESQVIAFRASAEALRQELDFIQGTRSWKITAPLRRWKGRGA